MIFGENIVEDVLSYLPNWGVKENTKGEPTHEYDHSYCEAFLPETKTNKEQLYIAKYVTADEIKNEYMFTEEYVKSYTGRYRLPQSPELYMAICKFTAGNLYLKYTVKMNQQFYGDNLKKSAKALIEPYVIIESHDIGHRSRRRFDYPPWYLEERPHPHHRGDHPPRGGRFHGHHRPILHLKKPYFIIETITKKGSITIQTCVKPKINVYLLTCTARMPCKCTYGWYKRSRKPVDVGISFKVNRDNGAYVIGERCNYEVKLFENDD